MSEMCMRKIKSKLSFRFEILLGAIVLAVLAGLSTAGYAKPSKRRTQTLPPDKKVRIFDPFTFRRTTVTVEEIRDSGSVSSNRIRTDGASPERLWRTDFDNQMSERARAYSYLIRIPLGIIRIPFRPCLRSPFRPPLIPHGPTS